MSRCSFHGLRIFPDGENELDPCIYKEIEKWRNVTVSVMQCQKCGRLEISWEKQEDSEQVEE